MREESSESFDTINDLRAVRYTLGQTKPHQNSVSFFPNKSALFAHIATRYPLYPILQNQIAWIPTYYKWIPTALVTLRNFTFIPYKKTVRTVEQPLKSLKKWATFIFKVLTLLKMPKERKEQKQLLLMGKFQWDIFDDFAILWWYTTTSTTAHINSDPQLLQNITPQYSSSVFYRWTWPPPNEDLKKGGNWNLKVMKLERSSTLDRYTKLKWILIGKLSRPWRWTVCWLLKM